MLIYALSFIFLESVKRNVMVVFDLNCNRRIMVLERNLEMKCKLVSSREPILQVEGERKR